MGFFSSDPEPTIVDLVNQLETSGITIYALKALDYVVPDQWDNPTNFDELMKKVTGETDAELLEQVKQRVITLYNDESEGYKSAVSIYQRIDSTDKLVGTAALANKLSENFSMLSFLDKITPKADNAQAFDLVVKILGELFAFTKINGIPGDGIADFVKSLGNYAGEAKMRMAAIVAFDGLIPLGPDFIQKATETVKSMTAGQMEENSTFKNIMSYIPSGFGGGQIAFVTQAFGSVSGWITNFVNENNLKAETVVANLSKYVELADGKLDYVAGFIDMSTDYMTHTGIQTIATQMIKRAINEV